ncbi:zinc finger CCHC domain-containing protein 17 isoform X3 [Pyxicephalus adspersus]
MSSAHVDRPSEVVDVGEKVWVKVIGNEVKDGKQKISLSMKVVHQGTGKDIDPNNVVLEQDERKRREFRDYSKQKITLEAVLNTVCNKCGCKGHFAKDCFLQPGGTKYALVPEEDEEDQTNSEKTAKKKKKHEKKRKKRSREKEDSSDSESSSTSSSDSDSAPAKKKKRHAEKSKKSSKKKKKHKKHKQRH